MDNAPYLSERRNKAINLCLICLIILLIPAALLGGIFQQLASGVLLVLVVLELPIILWISLKLMSNPQRFLVVTAFLGVVGALLNIWTF